MLNLLPINILMRPVHVAITKSYFFACISFLKILNTYGEFNKIVDNVSQEPLKKTMRKSRAQMHSRFYL